MALSRNTVLGIGFGIFGASLIMASGPIGVAFGAALLYSALLAATITAMLHLATLTPSNSTVVVGRPAPTVSFWPSFFHRPFAGVTSFFRPAHPTTTVRTATPRGHVPPATRTHTQSFHPAGSTAGAPRTSTTTSRGFTPSYGSTSRSPSFSHSFTPSVGSSHTRTFVPRR
jgi:hypothetical protein